MANLVAPNLDPILNTGGVGWYLKRGTIDFMEGSYQQQFATLLNKMILDVYSAPNVGTVYILFGCVDTISGGNHNITAGYVYANGEIYQSPAQIVAVSGSLPLVANMLQTSWQPIDAVGNHYADPQEFDGSPSNSNIHIQRTCVFVTGTSGSGTLNGGASTYNDLNNFLSLSFQNQTIETRTNFNGDTITFDKNRTIVYSASATGTPSITFDLTNRVIGSKVICYFNPSTSTSVIFTSITIISGSSLAIINSFSPVLPSLSGVSDVYVEFEYLGIISGVAYFKQSLNYS